MEIKKVDYFGESLLDDLLTIWLEGNIEAHAFIPESYWRENQSFVRKEIAKTEVFVCAENEKIVGFLGLSGSYLAGLFIKKDYHKKGMGNQLLDQVKELRAALSLSVYRKNSRAIRFYKRQGFVIHSESIDEGTGEAEYIMNWQRKND